MPQLRLQRMHAVFCQSEARASSATRVTGGTVHYDDRHSKGGRLAEKALPDSKKRMVESAALLFREQGYSGTGFRDVIGHSGAPRGSIYHHFPGGKSELAAETVRYAGEVV